MQIRQVHADDLRAIAKMRALDKAERQATGDEYAGDNAYTIGDMQLLCEAHTVLIAEVRTALPGYTKAVGFAIVRDGMLDRLCVSPHVNGRDAFAICDALGDKAFRVRQETYQPNNRVAKFGVAKLGPLWPVESNN